MRERRKQRAAGTDLPLFGALSLVENEKPDTADEMRPERAGAESGDALTDLPITSPPEASPPLAVEDLILPEHDLPDLPLQRDPNAPAVAERFADRETTPQRPPKPVDLPIAAAPGPSVAETPRPTPAPVRARTPTPDAITAPYARPVDRARELMEGISARGVLAPESEPQLGPAAGWGQRLQAGLVDAGIFAALLVGVAYLTHRLVPLPLALTPRVAAFLAFALLLAAFYAGYFTGTTGQTPGKMMQGLRVIDDAGEAPGFVRACGRGLLGLMGVALAGLGTLPGLFDSDHRAFHDRVFRTRVVSA